MDGWIKLHRQLADHDLWLSEPFTRGQAWVDLIMLANHAEGSIRVRGIKLSVQRGQVGWSEASLAERWKWSRTKVRHFILELQKEQQIIQQKDNKTSIITLVNYEVYNPKEQQEEQQKERQKDSRKTAKEQQKDTNKNDKKNKNDKNDSSKERYADFVMMTSEEYQKLIEKFGEKGTRDWVDALNYWKGSKGRKTNSDYLTILNWDRREQQKKNEQSGKSQSNNRPSSGDRGFYNKPINL